MSIPKNKTCPHCKLPVREYHDLTTCDSCNTSLHDKCWQEADGCTVCSLIDKPVSAARGGLSSWYLYHEGKNLGPLTWDQLCNYPGIQPDDLVWNNRLPEWVRADQVPNLPLAEPPLSGEPAAKPAPDERVGGSVVLPEMKRDPDSETGAVGGKPAPSHEEEITPYRQATPQPDPEEHDWTPDRLAAAEAAVHDSDYISSQKPARDPNEPGEAEPSVVLPETEEYFDRETPAGGDLDPQLFETEENSGFFAGEELSPQPFPQFQDSDRDNRMPPLIDDLPDPSLDFISTRRLEQHLVERKELARRYSRHMVFGILLLIAGAAAIAASLIYTLDKSELINLVAWGAIVLGTCDFFYGLFGWLKNKSR